MEGFGAEFWDIIKVGGGGGGVIALYYIAKFFQNWNKDRAEANKILAEAHVIEAEAAQKAAETSIYRKASAIDHYEKVNSALRDGLESLENRFAGQEIYSKQLKVRLDEQEAQYRLTLEMLQKSEQRHSDYLIESEKEKKQLLEQYHGLLAEHGQLKAEHGQLKEENKVLHDRVDELEREVDVLTSKIKD